MNLTRDELLKQKAIIENHLAWLNEKLAQLPSVSDAYKSEHGAAEANEPIHDQVQPTTHRLATHAVAENLSPDPDHVDPSQFVSQNDFKGVTTTQKTGCIFVAVAICVAFIWLLFGEYLVEKLSN